MFNFKSIIKRIFKRNDKALPPATPSRASVPLSGKRVVGRGPASTLTGVRVSRHAGARTKPLNWRRKKLARQKIAKRSRRINRKQV